MMSDATNGVGSAASAAASKGKSFTTFLEGVSVKGKGLKGILEETSGSMGRLGAAANDGAGKLGIFARAGQAIMSMGLPGILAGITLGFLALGAAGISAAAQVEKSKANLLTMVKSTTAMNAAWAGLVEFANKTPFSLDQSVEGFTKLRALGLATSADIMMSYGNTAAAMGKNMSQMIEAVADATTGEFERLKEFGIKASQQGDKVSFTFQGVTKTVGKNSKEIQDYLVGIGKVNFGGAMARQMDTLNGAFANLEDKFFLFMASMGDGMFGATVKDMVNTLAEGIGAMTPMFSGLMDIFGGLLQGVWEIIKGVGNLFTVQFGGAAGATAMMSNLAVAASYVGTVFSVIGKIIGAVFSFIGQAAGMVVNGIQWAFASLFDWLTPSFGDTGQSAGESLVGILRAAEFVANQLPNIFKVALAEIKAAFMQTGAALAKALIGDFSGFGKIDLSFSRTKKVGGAVWEGAKKTYGDKKANRAWIDQAAGVGTKGDISFDALGDGKKTAGKDKAGAADKSAANKAKQQEDFWKGLEQELALSKLNTQEREKQAKVFEYQKIVGRDITADEATRLATLMEQTRVAKFATEALEAHNKKQIDFANQEALLKMRQSGASSDQLEIEKSVLDARADALTKGLTQADLQGDIFRQAEATLRSDLAREQAIKNQNKALDDQAAKTKAIMEAGSTFGKAALATHGTIGQRRGLAQTAYDERVSGLNAALNSKDKDVKISAAEFAAGVKKAGEEFHETMAEIGDEFSAKMRDVGDLLSDIGSRVGGKLGSFIDSIGSAANSISNFKTAQTDIGSKFDKVFGTTNSPFLKGMGKAVGGAVAGAEMGKAINSALAPIGKALGFKTSKTGAQIGGALGSFGGPIGSAVGSIVGSIAGGLLKKTRYGTAAIGQMAGGELGVSSLTGNSTSRKDGSNSAAGSVISGLQSIAAELGATLTGSPSVSIGMYKKDWRVSDTGRTGKLKGKYSDVTDFGDDAEAAVAYAIQVALKDGILTGISEFSKRVISANGDEQALTLAKNYENILKSLSNFHNPIKGAVEEATKDLNTLAEQMKKAGATSAELGSLEEYRSLKLKEILDDQLSGLTETMKQLNGSASGKTPFALLQEDLKGLDKFRATIASGGTVNSDEFNSLVQTVMGELGDVYGTNTKQYQDAFTDLKALTEAAMGNATSEFNKASGAEATTAAVETQTEQVTTAINTSNDLLTIIANAVTNGKMIGAAITGQNGVLLNAN
ncbi:hypothetical protein [Sphingobium sp. KCTC 72723]|uniref:hypothetical protein n=1 Tax=Sphingobium sp. KCTC 72723 TaxID=2733867 RepID=UPI001CB74F3A|nr:hypothetical protein [Sphingobium sp. KCTC 72723]